MAAVASARRYAQAVFSLALDHGQVEDWREDLKVIAATLADPQLAPILENPKMHFADKVELLDRCLPDLGRLPLNFACLVVSKQLLGLVSQIVAEYQRMADAHEGREHARLLTAVPLEEDEAQRMVEHLGRLTGKKIVLATDVDPGVIGGFVARIGDRLIDGSTRAKLEALRNRLVAAG